MGDVGVLVHEAKSIGSSGPGALRAALARHGLEDPPWRGVARSREAPRQVRRLVAAGVDRIVVWGGDGTVRRVVHALVRADVHHVSVGVVPAGTANLLAHGLGVPVDLDAALDLALHGPVRAVDVGRVNGQHFVVMAGAGFDARMIGDADDGLKDRVGRLSYLWTGARNLTGEAVRARVRVDGEAWYDGPASCLLVANIGTLMGGVRAFPHADPRDGRLDVGVVRARTRAQWLRVLAATAAGRAERSGLVEATTARKVKVVLDRPLPWELDGGAGGRDDTFRYRVLPGRIRICTP